ncbi:MAG: CoA-binding protein [Desulfarculus sp.]|nr:CoA-binding protein [Desulfarculus sp.]
MSQTPPGEPRHPSPEEVRQMLGPCRVIAVVGLSPNPSRDSHRVAAYLLAQGFTVIPVNPKEEAILGQKCYPSLGDIPGPVDLVDVFRASEHAPAVAREAVAKGAKGLWLQEGVKSLDAAAMAQEAGLWFVQDRCLMVEHRRHLVPRP